VFDARPVNVLVNVVPSAKEPQLLTLPPPVIQVEALFMPSAVDQYRSTVAENAPFLVNVPGVRLKLVEEHECDSREKRRDAACRRHFLWLNICPH